ncbi:MAG TPA: cupin domain-containing protein [Bradyrhizobium sp.]|nr:cupin domain-containing protein [Bradyrhizobium sp.]
MLAAEALTTALTLTAAAVICTFGGQITGAQQQPIKRTDLLKTYLPEMEGKEMQVWVADIPPGAATGPHFHPTPRFVYVLEGAVVLELDGKGAADISGRSGVRGDAGRTSQLPECKHDRTR